MQTLACEWYGKALAAPFRFSFAVEGDHLVYRAACDAPALVHPEASPDKFQENLWMYDTAEFFIARADLSAYLECNVSPNGAWWSAVFSAPRVAHPQFTESPKLQASGEMNEQGWSCEARLALSELDCLGIDLNDCKVAACAILQSPAQLFATTGNDCSGEPDFHRLGAWGTFTPAG